MLAGAVRWNSTAPRVEQAELRLSGEGEAWRVGVVLVRFDPTQVDLRLAYTPDRFNRPGRWTVNDAPDDALFALNAGQFSGRGPWGWKVQDGIELGG